MAGKTVPLTLRKPPQQDNAARDAFVRGADAQTSRRSNAQTSGGKSSNKAVVKRVDGRELRRMTVYLPTDLAARLRVHCAEADIDLSEFVARAVAGHLSV